MLRKFFLLLLTVGNVVTGCSKDDVEKALQGGKTEITVHLKDSDGTPLPQWVVYGYSQFRWESRTHSFAKQAATDANGKATFSLEGIDIGGATSSQEVYRFVVYYTKTKTNIFGEKISSEALTKIVPITVKEGEDQTIEIKLDATSGGNNGGGNGSDGNNGTPIVRQPAEINVIIKDTEGNPLSGATVTVGGISKVTDVNGKASGFEGQTHTIYDWTVRTQCGETKRGTLSTGDKGLEYTIDSFKSEKGTIVITNNSSNPYTVTIGNQKWVIEGKRTLNLTAFYNTTYTVEWKQNSGYLIYPTTGSKNVKLDCNQGTVAVSFP